MSATIFTISDNRKKLQDAFNAYHRNNIGLGRKVLSYWECQPKFIERVLIDDLTDDIVEISIYDASENEDRRMFNTELGKNLIDAETLRTSKYTYRRPTLNVYILREHIQDDFIKSNPHFIYLFI